MEIYTVSDRDKRWVKEMAQARREISVSFLRGFLRRIDSVTGAARNESWVNPLNSSVAENIKELDRLKELAKTLISFQGQLDDPSNGEERREFYKLGSQIDEEEKK